MKKEEGNKIIAEFMKMKIDGDWYLIPYLETTTKTGWYQVGRMEFHTSWDWQIPVYSKLAKEMKELKEKEKHRLTPDLKYIQLTLEYQVAIFENSHQRGFEIIVENLQWLNQTKK